ncbi:MAG TPA: MarR family transcriptional regulator [Candidatus Binataceae bacterium]
MKNKAATRGASSYAAAGDGRRDPAAVGRFVERSALNLSEAGFPRMTARVFVGILIAADGRRTASELAHLLRVSPAAISGAVRYLAQVGLVGREREPGQRRDHYRVFDDMWYEAFTRREQLFTRWEQGLREGIEAVGRDTAAGARLDETRRFFGFIHGEFPRLMDRWRKLRGAASGAPRAESTHRA